MITLTRYKYSPLTVQCEDILKKIISNFCCAWRW